MSMKDISKRTKVLMIIREFELKNNRGILYKELLEIGKRRKLSAGAVSKSFDSLMDMGLLEDDWIVFERDGERLHTKAITTDNKFHPFIDTTIKDIKKQVRGCRHRNSMEIEADMGEPAYINYIHKTEKKEDGTHIYYTSDMVHYWCPDCGAIKVGNWWRKPPINKFLRRRE